MKILIDTDPGIDDAMAIHLAFAHPGLEVLGLTTVFGNLHVEKATRNALALTEMAGIDCPVAAGAAGPLTRAVGEMAYDIHGPEGLGDLPAPAPTRRVTPGDAADFIIRTMRAQPQEVTLIAIGPLTNIALALRRAPDIAGLARDVVIMGGAVETRGNTTPWAEANIWQDPHAAAEVLGADWPVTLVGLDVTHRARCDQAGFARLATRAPIIGGFLDRITSFYLRREQRRGETGGCFLHDPAAVLAAIEPELFEMREMPIRVVTEGAEIGRTVAHARTGERVGTPEIRVCMGVDGAALRERFLAILEMADAVRARRQL